MASSDFSFPFSCITPPVISLAHTPTPMVLLKSISKSLNGPRIWLKRDDLTGSGLSGNKVRKLEYVVAQALQEGCDTLITCGGIQSNHCRATALVAAQLGLKACLILRNDLGEQASVDGNLLLDHVAGAEVHLYSARQYRKELPMLLDSHKKRLAAEGRKSFIIPTGASDDIGVWGYVGACLELQRDFANEGISPTAIVVATGSGGTQAGLTAGAHLLNLGADVVGMAVCDNEQYFIDKVTADLTAWRARYHIDINLAEVSIQVNDQYIGPGYGQASAEVFDTIAWVARSEGVILDPVYTGKAFHGLIEEIKSGCYRDAADIVFVHTGGIFGLFAQKDQFGFSIKGEK